MDVVAVMDEVAEKLRAAPSLAGRTFEWPNGKVRPPAAIVTYPPGYDFDKTYGRGVDTMAGVVVVIVGQVDKRQTRDMFGTYTSGPESIKTLIDGDEGDYASCDSVSVVRWETDTHTIGEIDYLAIVFELAITGPGTP